MAVITLSTMPVASALSSKHNENMHGKIVIKYLYDYFHGHLKSKLTEKDPPNGPDDFDKS